MKVAKQPDMELGGAGSKHPPVTLDDLRASDKATITRKEVAAVLEVDPRTVSEAIESGVIPAISVGRLKKIPREKFWEMFG